MTLTLTGYRKQIRDAWLGRVGRRSLKSHEYDFIRDLFLTQTPVETVLKAIQKCADRARRTRTTIYSLGVIKADIRTVMAQQADLKVGAHTTAQGDWRERWAHDLREDIESYPQLKEPFEKLIADLPNIEKDEAEKRWIEAIKVIAE